MASLLERLETREAAARARVEGLRAEMDRLAGQLAAQQELLERLQITRQTVIEVLAGDDLGEDGLVADATPHGGVDGGVGAAPGATPASGTLAGTGLQVPVFGQDGDADGRTLPVAYRDVVEVLADAGMPLRAMQVCQALGLGGEPRHREGMRSKLKRLVRRGWLVEVAPGQFTCAAGVLGVGSSNGSSPAPARR
jgi:hypothetical protein